MALTKLYDEGRKVRRSDLCFDEGIAEIGGIEAVAPLCFVQEERPKMIEGAKVYGRVREGIIVVPARYGFFNPYNTPRRGIVPRGLPLINPKEATQANRDGKWYAPDMKKYSEAIFAALMNAIPIDEKDVKDNVLELMLDDFVSKYTLSLFGGEGSQQEIEDRVKNAGKYFRQELDKVGKNKVKSQKLYLPPLETEEEKIIGTQILSCGLIDEFDLDARVEVLDYAESVFGVQE